jgi:hypothetical protein
MRCLVSLTSTSKYLSSICKFEVNFSFQHTNLPKKQVGKAEVQYVKQLLAMNR